MEKKLTAEAVTSHLKTKTIGRPVDCYPRVDSTNDVAKKRARGGAKEGLVIVAEEQTKGRGRRGRRWVSPRGRGIWNSVLLRPNVSADQGPALALAAALAWVQAIDDATELTAGIKWPNDVVVNDKKLAGILVEAGATTGRVRYIIVGSGLNVDVKVKHVPDDYRTPPTSLVAEAGHPVDRSFLLACYLNRLEHVYDTYRQGGFTYVLPAIRARMTTLGRFVTVLDGLDETSSWHGVAQEIGDDGALHVRRPGGSIHPVYAGEVSLRLDADGET